MLQASLKVGGISSKIRLIPDTEKANHCQLTEGLINDLARFDKNRRIFIVAFGGGVVGDLAGFVAAIYKRGIPYIQVPTTLLAQIDSSIGGKTGLDLSAGKNLVGAFYQPRAVVTDLSVLSTLNKHQLRQGLSEAIKYGIVGDSRLFSYIEKNISSLLTGDTRALAFVVTVCCRIKADIVSRDEREEKSLRTILNFGHTIGHAIETAAGYVKYRHGEAVALGMLAATCISRQMGHD